MSRHILFETGIRRLGSKEKGFFYRYPDSGETVREERVLKRIENLKVPPAWKEARIARSPSAKVQAVGYDSAGRVQYLYHQRYRERKEREKFERILRFADKLPEMRCITSEHLRHEKLDRENAARRRDESRPLPDAPADADAHARRDLARNQRRGLLGIPRAAIPGLT